MNSSQVIDLVVLCVLLYCTIRGASRGLLSQLAWAAALLLCFKFSGTLSPLIEPLIAVEPPLKHWLSMLAVYVSLCGATFLGAGLIGKWLEDARLGGFDRHLGALLGLVRGVVICMTGMYFLITMSADIRNAVSKTWSGYGAALILSHSQVLLQLVPDHSTGAVEQVLNRFGQHLQPAADELASARPASAGAFVGQTEGAPGSWLGEGGSGFDLGRLAGRSESPSENSSAEDLLGSLPSELREQLSEVALRQLLESTPEERQRLLKELSGEASSGAGSMLSGWLRRVSGADVGQGAERHRQPLQLSAVDGRLLDEISAIYSQRSDIISGAREHLTGLPSLVVHRVLEDWHADALGLSRDPDIGTDVDTRLDERIVRQLGRAGVSLEQLDRDLRSRLRGI
jgi:membrane protein required for colicin V production